LNNPNLPIAWIDGDNGSAPLNAAPGFAFGGFAAAGATDAFADANAAAANAPVILISLLFLLKHTIN
jgi:alpha/beta superfamily hydrolase